jgi:large subunit ribosomal protein L19
MNVVEELGLELSEVKRELDFEVGDTVRVHYKIIEGTRERIQIYEGAVIAINNKCAGKTFTVRRVSFDVGVERVFPLQSPRIAKVEVVRKSKIRRSKLYFLRERKGKSAKLKERRHISKK